MSDDGRSPQIKSNQRADDAVLQPVGPCLADLGPHHLLPLIWEHLTVADRKALLCTARCFRECPGAKLS
jgi:hypothetical protein